MSEVIQISDFAQMFEFTRMSEFALISQILTSFSLKSTREGYARLSWLSDSLCDTNVDSEELIISLQEDRSTLVLGALMLLEY